VFDFRVAGSLLPISIHTKNCRTKVVPVDTARSYFVITLFMLSSDAAQGQRESRNLTHLLRSREILAR
jgi:hypothetical protein